MATPQKESSTGTRRKKKKAVAKRRMKLSDFWFKGELGRGTYGSVFKALRRGKTKPYAIKVINMKGMSKKQLHDCSEEVRILSSLKNENRVIPWPIFFGLALTWTGVCLLE